MSHLYLKRKETLEQFQERIRKFGYLNVEGHPELYKLKTWGEPYIGRDEAGCITRCINVFKAKVGDVICEKDIADLKPCLRRSFRDYGFGFKEKARVEDLYYTVQIDASLVNGEVDVRDWKTKKPAKDPLYLDIRYGLVDPMNLPEQPHIFTDDDEFFYDISNIYSKRDGEIEYHYNEGDINEEIGKALGKDEETWQTNEFGGRWVRNFYSGYEFGKFSDFLEGEWGKPYYTGKEVTIAELFPSFWNGTVKKEVYNKHKNLLLYKKITDEYSRCPVLPQNYGIKRTSSKEADGFYGTCYTLPLIYVDDDGDMIEKDEATNEFYLPLEGGRRFALNLQFPEHTYRTSPREYFIDIIITGHNFETEEAAIDVYFVLTNKYYGKKSLYLKASAIEEAIKAENMPDLVFAKKTFPVLLSKTSKFIRDELYEAFKEEFSFSYIRQNLRRCLETETHYDGIHKFSMENIEAEQSPANYNDLEEEFHDENEEQREEGLCAYLLWDRKLDELFRESNGRGILKSKYYSIRSKMRSSLWEHFIITMDCEIADVNTGSDELQITLKSNRSTDTLTYKIPFKEAIKKARKMSPYKETE